MKTIVDDGFAPYLVKGAKFAGKYQIPILLKQKISLPKDFDLVAFNERKNAKNKKEDDGDKMDLISIDEFAKVEIRIGEIVEAEKIEKSDKLLRTQINIGEKTIQVVAGLAKRYAPEDLVGRKVPVVTNLKPAKLFGTLSEGMIMATESAALLTPDDCEVGELLM